MNKFAEMIQKGEELIAKTNEILNNELDLDVAGTVSIATYLTDLKDIHKESLEFTNPDIVANFEQYRENLSNEEYMDYLTRFLMVRNIIEGDLRDRLYDKTAKYDIALNNNLERYKQYNKEIDRLNNDIAAIRGDIASIDTALAVLRNNNVTDNFALMNFRQSLVERITNKEAEIETIKEEQKRLLYGGSSHNVAPVITQENNLTEDAPENVVDNVPAENINPEVVLPENEQPENTEIPGAENDVPVGDESDVVNENDENLIPVFPVLPGEEEQPELPGENVDETLPELPEEVEDEEVLPELPEEVEDEEVLPGLPEEVEDEDEEVLPELPEEFEDEEEQTDTPVLPVQDDDEEVEVVQHTDAKPTLLRKIGTIIGAVIAMLGSLSAMVVTVDHFQNHHNDEPALEQDTQIDDNVEEDDILDDTTPENTVPEDIVPEDTTPENTTPENTVPEDTTPEDTTPENTTPENTQPENKVEPLPAQLEVGEVIYDTETGVEVTHDGTTYLNSSEGVADVIDNQDLVKTDSGASIVTQDNIQYDLNPATTVTQTGNEQTYEEAVKDMSAEEISELDAAIAQFASEFDSSYTLKP